MSNLYDAATQQTYGEIGSLPDPPVADFSGIKGDEPWEVGQWYQGTFQDQYSFINDTGNENTFVSEDTPAQAGDSRNIFLRVQITRQADKRELNTNLLVNYRPTDTTAEAVAAVQAKTAETRTKLALVRLGTLQRIAGIRQFHRNGNGGFDLTPLFGKTGFFKLNNDTRPGKERYLAITDFRDTKPVKVPVL